MMTALTGSSPPSGIALFLAPPSWAMRSLVPLPRSLLMLLGRLTGAGTVLLNLLTADRAIVCVDPEGENTRVGERARRRFGPVFVPDP